MRQQHYNFLHYSIHRKTALKVTHMNLYHCKKSVQNFLSSHTYPKMIFVSSGSCILKIEQSSFSLSENKVLFVNPGNFEYSLEPISASVDFIMVGFENIEFIFPYEDNMSRAGLFSVFSTAGKFYLSEICEELQNRSAYYQHTCDYYVNLLFILLQRQYNLEFKTKIKEKSTIDCKAIRNYLDEHFTEDITLDHLSKISKMNKYHLVHSFTNSYGCSPINYLNEKKIEESKRLLEETTYSIAEIARIIGFSSQSYFSQAFKKHTYMTPNEYRRSTKYK